MIARDELYVGGQWIAPAEKGAIEVENPATEETIARVPEGTREDVERTTDNPEAVKRDIPPGAHWLYAVRPEQPAARERRRVDVDPLPVLVPPVAAEAPDHVAAAAEEKQEG